MNWYWYERTANERTSEVAHEAERRRLMSRTRRGRRFLKLDLAPSARLAWRAPLRLLAEGILRAGKRPDGATD
jgi:hypothetical protein